MNIIFLDIDGVLNNTATFMKHESIDSLCVKNFVNAIKNTPNIRVVISSSWRDHLGNFEGFKTKLEIHKSTRIFNPIIKYLHTDWWTPKLGSFRGDEIQKWIDSHTDVDKYLCIDDDSDFYEHQPLLQTDRRLGFTYTETLIVQLFFNMDKSNKEIILRDALYDAKYSRKMGIIRNKFINEYLK